MAQWGRGKKGGCGQVFAANLEDEIEMSPSIDRNIGYQNQWNEIEELSSQIATLVRKVQRLQLHSKGSNGSKDHQLDDFFGSPHRHRAYSHGLNFEWNGTVKDLVFSEFRGSYNLDVLEEWLKTVESHFQYYDVPEAKKVKLVSQSLKGRASNWWKQLQVGRQRNGQEKIREWRKMRKKFKEHFLPSNHGPSLLVVKQHKKGISSSGHQCQRQCKKGISSSGRQCQSGFATEQPSYDYFQVGCSTSVGVEETFDEGYHLKMLFSGEVVEPRYDEEEAAIFGEEDMGENCGQEQDCSQALSICDENFPVFDQDDEPDHDQDVAIFDDDSEVLAYEEVDVCEYEGVVACEYEGVSIFDNYDDEDDPLVEAWKCT